MSNTTIFSSVYAVMLLAISMVACISIFLVPSSAESSSSSFSSSVEAKALLYSGWWGNFSLRNHCYLKGITCNGAGSVIRMDAYFCSPHGKLAKMNWSSLLNLEYLDLSNSRLTGEIPAEIASLSKLEHLDLSFNYDLQGVLPPTLGNLTQLVHLDLSAMNIRGPIPSSIGNLRALIYLSFHSNQLNGPIPQAIGNLTRLTYLNLSLNLFLGPIPRQLERLCNLEYFGLGRNHLIGTIPNGLAYLPQLKYLDLSHNNLSGKIPDCLCLVTTLNLSFNHLEFQIPNGCPYGVCNKAKYSSSCFYSTVNTSFDSPYCSSCMANKGKRKTKLALCISLPVIVFLALLVIVSFCFRKTKKNQCEAKSMKHGDVFSIWNYDGRIV